MGQIKWYLVAKTMVFGGKDSDIWGKYSLILGKPSCCFLVVVVGGVGGGGAVVVV